MQAFIKNDKLIVNTMIHDNEKDELLDFIERAETNGVSAETLYNIEGDKSGIAFGFQKSVFVDTSDATAEAKDIIEGKTAYVNGEKVTGSLSGSFKIINGIRFDYFPFEELPDEWTNADWSDYKSSGSSGLFQSSNKLKRARSLNKFKPTSIGNYCYTSSSVETVEYIDTSLCTSVTQAFCRCSNLKNVPILSWESIVATNFNDYIASCPKLTDESLQNVLKTMLTYKGTSNYISSCTLKKVGFSNEQIAKVTQMPEWTELEAKGWTTGL